MDSSKHDTDTSVQHPAGRLRPRQVGLLAAVAALTVAVALPTAAGASQVVQATGGLNQLTVTAPSGEVNRIRVSDDGLGFVRVRDAVPLRDGAAPCSALSSFEVRCAVDRDTAIVVRPGDRDDRVEVASELRVGIEGGAGNDTYAGGLAASSHVLFFGDAGIDTASYAGSNVGVEVRVADGLGDGREGDFDDIRDAERLIGSRFRDRLAGAFNTVDTTVEGGAGEDILTSSGGRDVLIGGPGVDTMSSGANVDRVIASDPDRDFVECGGGTPDEVLASLIGEASIIGCERIFAISSATNSGGLVGTLRLTPAMERMAAGGVARLRVGWTHPRSWRRLRRVVLRFYEGPARVATVDVRPGAKRITVRGVARLVRRYSRVARRRKTVTASLALRLERSRAGRRLRVEVEAVDIHGRRQINRNAGEIRVTRSPAE